MNALRVALGIEAFWAQRHNNIHHTTMQCLISVTKRTASMQTIHSTKQRANACLTSLKPIPYPNESSPARTPRPESRE